MTTVRFYGKPGCVNNERQKEVLRQAGYEVRDRDIRAVRWRPALLRAFLEPLSVAEWFNPSAPAIRDGRVSPHDVGPEEALALMVADPLLIRRPLLGVGARRRAGFDTRIIWTELGVRVAADQDWETCPRTPTVSPELQGETP